MEHPGAGCEERRFYAAMSNGGAGATRLGVSESPPNLPRAGGSKFPFWSAAARPRSPPAATRRRTRVSTLPALHHPRRERVAPPHLRRGAVGVPLLIQEGRRGRAGGWLPGGEAWRNKMYKLQRRDSSPRTIDRWRANGRKSGTKVSPSETSHPYLVVEGADSNNLGSRSPLHDHPFVERLVVGSKF